MSLWLLAFLFFLKIPSTLLHLDLSTCYPFYSKYLSPRSPHISTSTSPSSHGSGLAFSMSLNVDYRIYTASSLLPLTLLMSFLASFVYVALITMQYSCIYLYGIAVVWCLRSFAFVPGTGYISLHQYVTLLSSSRAPTQINVYQGEWGPQSIGENKKKLDQRCYKKCYHWEYSFAQYGCDWEQLVRGCTAWKQAGRNPFGKHLLKPSLRQVPGYRGDSWHVLIRNWCKLL